jgi:hypothetical protein
MIQPVVFLFLDMIQPVVFLFLDMIQPVVFLFLDMIQPVVFLLSGLTGCKPVLQTKLRYNQQKSALIFLNYT